MAVATPTRERLLNEAVRLFSANGYEATSISQIEAAAGLVPGRGAIYNHFESKNALLDAGIDRQLERRQAMGSIRALFAGLGDLRAELTALGRCLLAVIDQEIDLVQIAARTPTGRSAHLDAAYAALIDGLKAELIDWITAWAPTLTREQSEVLAALALNSILGARLETGLFNQPQSHISDSDYLTEWTTLLATRIETLN